MSVEDQARGRLGFLGRWLLATWLPPVALCLLTAAMIYVAPSRAARPYLQGLASLLPFLLWLLMAGGQAWAIGPHCPRRRQWAVAAFVAGVLAMLCLFYGSGMFPRHRGELGRALTLLAIWFLGIAGPTTLTLVPSAALFGVIVGAAQAALLRWPWRARAGWMLFSAAAGVVSFGWLAPPHWWLQLELMVSFGDNLPPFTTLPLLLVGPSMVLFMLGWLVFALLTGLGLAFAFERQHRQDQARIAASFD